MITTTARAVHQVLTSARCAASQQNLDDLRYALRQLGKTAPVELHLPILSAHDEIEDAADDLAAAPRTLRGARAARERLQHALDEAEAVILKCDPTAADPYRPTDMPGTAPEILRSTLAYTAPYTRTPAELDAIEQGTPCVEVYCRKDAQKTRLITAVVSAGVETEKGFVSAHPGLVYHVTSRDGRYDAAHNARRVLGRYLVADVPARWISAPDCG